MSGFSAAVKLGDLDDFLSPANDCIVPLVSDTKTKPGIMKSKTKENEKVATISLSDCLACSGCVTSAETILLESQSAGELLTKVGSHQIFLTVSSASRRALSQHYQISPLELCGFLYTNLRAQLGDNLVVTDVSLSEAIVLEETMVELEERKFAGKPMLTSHCPGWTCYAVKVLGDDILPTLSRVKSAEQIHGLLLKKVIPRFGLNCMQNRMQKSPGVAPPFHVLISPCFDKKLEIIRPDYEQMVDLALATTELVGLLGDVGETQKKIYSHPLDVYTVMGLRDVWVPASSGVESGGYAQVAGARTGGLVEWKLGKNSDLMEFKSFLRSNGFRNIQNVTRRVRSGKLDGLTNLVEIMACPGGCPKGGGQPKFQAQQELSWIERWNLWLHPSQSIDPWMAHHTCLPSQYVPARRAAKLVARENLRTTWTSLAPVNPETGEKRATASALKW